MTELFDVKINNLNYDAGLWREHLLLPRTPTAPKERRTSISASAPVCREPEGEMTEAETKRGREADRTVRGTAKIFSLYKCDICAKRRRDGGRDAADAETGKERSSTRSD